MLGVHHRGQLGQHLARDGEQVALPLQHAGEARQVGLQPVLLLVGARRLRQGDDHLVEVVLEDGDLAAGLDVDRLGEVALGHRGRHVADGAHLAGEVARQLVHVVGQVAPDAGGAGHVGLAPQLALDAHVARHAGHLLGEGATASRSCC